ncbi:hypothetical protein DM558_11790 [Entomomonas moraniae]|uniref:Uncharacterized protein n=1 Tax=Entomomonas moraniae TaxID=2213226 RepID=A0A3Q9JNW0_9GAMM|nr:hypothetical protein [Entomomonas moraniae]AZS51406.1 hypothetical protein DM558_11790 [Entomomonas moraniae]
MRKLRNLCLLIILVAFIIFGGTKALLWYYTEKTAKDIQNALPPGAFNYTGITTSLNGSTSLDNINLLINGQNVKIEKIELATNNILELLLLIVKNWGSKIPNELTLKIKGIKVDIDSLRTTEWAAKIFNDSLSIPCGKINKMTTQDYNNMGYKYFIFDLNMGYKKISNTRVKLDADMNMRDALQVSLSFYGSTSIINPSAKKNIVPEFQINIKNNIIQEKLYDYCAKQENISLKEYVDKLPPYLNREDLDKDTVSSLELSISDNIMNALNEYQKKPQDLYFSTNPKGDISFNELKNMSEQAVIDLIRPSLKINGKNIPIEFEWMTADALSKRTAPKNTKTSIPIIQSSERILTTIDQLNEQAFNKKIEIHTTSGIVYKGAFKKVQGNLLHMTIYKSWGTSDLTLETNTIRLVYILSDF